MFANITSYLELISGYVVNNKTVYLIGCYTLKIKKLHVSAGSGHLQVLSFDSLKIILYICILYILQRGGLKFHLGTNFKYP